MLEVGRQFGSGLVEVILVVDPDEPAVGAFVEAGLHALGQQVVAEDLGVDIPGQSADLAQRSSPRASGTRAPIRAGPGCPPADLPPMPYPRLAQDHPAGILSPVRSCARERDAVTA